MVEIHTIDSKDSHEPVYPDLLTPSGTITVASESILQQVRGPSVLCQRCVWDTTSGCICHSPGICTVSTMYLLHNCAFPGSELLSVRLTKGEPTWGFYSFFARQRAPSGTGTQCSLNGSAYDGVSESLRRIWGLDRPPPVPAHWLFHSHTGSSHTLCASVAPNCPLRTNCLSNGALLSKRPFVRKAQCLQ